MVTQDSIKAKITNVEYHHCGLMTVCFMTVENGFVSIGQSACANAETYKPEKGEHNSYKDAVGKLFLLENYLLKQKAFEQSSSNGETK